LREKYERVLEDVDRIWFEVLGGILGFEEVSLELY
jgi:hypothetical protein